MPGGNGLQDLELLRVVEDSMGCVPKQVRKVYDRTELVNEIFLLMKSRGVLVPKKGQIRSAAIDIHRRHTHHPRVWNHPHHRKPHPKVKLESDLLLRPFGSDGGRKGKTLGLEDIAARRGTTGTAMAKVEIAEALRDVRRRFGTDGLAVFVMTRVMEIDPRTITWIMDFEPNSALAKSLTSIGGRL